MYRHHPSIKNPVDKYDRRPLRAFQLRVLASIESFEPEPAGTADVTKMIFGKNWTEVNRRQVQRAITALADRGLIKKSGEPDWRGTQQWQSLGIDY